MSTTDTILASLTEQVRQLQSAIDWIDDHRTTIDKCEKASVHAYDAMVYLHAGRNPKDTAKALGKWKRNAGCYGFINWELTDPKINVGLMLWDTEERQSLPPEEVAL